MSICITNYLVSKLFRKNITKMPFSWFVWEKFVIVGFDETRHLISYSFFYLSNAIKLSTNTVTATLTTFDHPAFVCQSSWILVLPVIDIMCKKHGCYVKSALQRVTEVSVIFENRNHAVFDEFIHPCFPSQNNIWLEGDRQWSRTSCVWSRGNNCWLCSPCCWPKSHPARPGANIL